MTMTTNKVRYYTENDLLPYPVIAAATTGDPEAISLVLRHFEGLIVSQSTRKLRDNHGNTYYGVDQDIYDRIRTRLIRAVLDFRA